ncbi:PRA1 family protein [Salix suchowensis]|nr:PRA1 family protein [Salix suchowensis]
MTSAAAPASYGPLPTTAPPSTFATRANNTTTTFFATRRPWRELIELRPFSLGDTTIRIKHNLSYFRVNYTMIILFILILSLLWHPFSMAVFLIIFVAWYFLFFFRGQPLVIFHRTIDDRVVLGLLGVVTIVALILTHVWLNVLVSLLIGAAIVVLHAASRRTDDLYLDELDLPSHMAQDIEAPLAVPARAMSPSESGMDRESGSGSGEE